ncbi:MAG: hypothetical protein AAFW60_02880 [Pseudomonadota bacterium]
MTFDLPAFKRRAKRVAEKQGRAYRTLSKELFNGAAEPLAKIMDPSQPDSEKTLPRLDTLFRADRNLAQLEKELGLAEA